jgi:hypothetical protein
MDAQVTPWWEADNDSYIYFNRGDGQWWLDGPDGKVCIHASLDGCTPAWVPYMARRRAPAAM